MLQEPTEVSRLIERGIQGDREAQERLYHAVESELRRLARGRINGLRRRLHPLGIEATQETTQLIDDAFLNLVGSGASFANRSHFVAVAAHRMRQLCRESARRALAHKRGAGARRVSLDDAIETAVVPALDPTRMLAVDQALERLARLDPRQASIVELRFFAGLGEKEIADCLGISESTVKREWRSARAWLQEALGGPAETGRARSDSAA